MSDERAQHTKGNDPADVDKDPEASDLEIDHANDEMGGPTTESLNAGLSTPLQPGGTTPGGGPGAGQGSLGTGGGQNASDDVGDVSRDG